MSFNATFAPLKAVQPTSAELYARAGVDYSSLSTIEQWWVDWYLWIVDPMIATGLMSFIMHEVRVLPFPTFVGPRGLNVLLTQIVYFGRAIPWIIIDAIPYFRKWKLQPVRFPIAASARLPPGEPLLSRPLNLSTEQSTDAQGAVGMH